MLKIYDNEKLADASECNVHKSWNQGKGFETLEEAYRYLDSWLGQHYARIRPKIGIKEEYSGYGDFIEIKEVKNANNTSK